MRTSGPAPRTLALVAGWALAAVAAAVVGVLSLSLLGSGITGGQVHVLSARDAASAWASATPGPGSGAPGPGTTTTAPTGPSTDTAPSTEATPPSGSTANATTRTASPSSSGPKAVTRALASKGGTVVARCRAGQVYLVSWTPRQGFEIDDPLRGPGSTAYVKFDSDELEVHVTVGCRGGRPVALSAAAHDD